MMRNFRGRCGCGSTSSGSKKTSVRFDLPLELFFYFWTKARLLFVRDDVLDVLSHAVCPHTVRSSLRS